MKKLLVILFALAACGAAYAQGTYFGIDTGYGMWTIEPENSSSEWKPANVSVALNAGKSYDSLRLEGSIGMTLAASDKVRGIEIEYSNYNLMFNVYYDFAITPSLIVYPTAGAGVIYSTIEIGSLDESAATFAMQLGLGARFQIDAHQSLDFTIRYLADNGPDYEFSSGDQEIDAESIYATLGYKFWF